MAIEFARSNIIGRSKGHSAVKAAAYRSGTDMTDEEIGQTVSYGHRAGEVAHSEILLPKGAPALLLDRQSLWQAIEQAENQSTRRADAQLAVDHIIALPRELSLTDQVALAKAFALNEFVSHGVAVDLNVHLHSKRNPHAHLMTTTRFIDKDGVGLKARALNGRFASGRKLVDEHQLRHRWARFQNEWAQRNGIDLLVTNNNGEWQAQVHQGPERPTNTGVSSLTALTDSSGDAQRPPASRAQSEDTPDPYRRNSGSSRASPLDDMHESILRKPDTMTRTLYNHQIQSEREASLASDPTDAIRRVARMKSVFSRHDIYRELSRHISDRDAFLNAKTRVDSCSILVQLTDPGPLGEWFTTTQVLQTEQEIAQACRTLAGQRGAIAVKPAAVEKLIDRHFRFLSQEQRNAVHYVVSGRRLAAVVGLAGTGKSTTLRAANELWTGVGGCVKGLALAGKAAQSLQEASGIASRTIHSFLYAHRAGREMVSAKDVFVLDEAGMVNDQLMASLLSVVGQAGATLIVVGDQDQLQPIQAGNPFRSIARNLGFVELATIRRQQQPWARRATYLFARHKTREALELLHEHRCIRKAADRDSAVTRIVADYVSNFTKGESAAQSIVLAHANREVQSLNSQIRQALVTDGLVKPGMNFMVAGDRIVEIGVGDRLLFKRNQSKMGVRNGSLGTILAVSPRSIAVRLDNGTRVAFDTTRYNDIDLGYAMTIHKAQGVTVDQVRVLVTPLWDRHLSYVALSRHRGRVEVYFGDDEFRGSDPYTRQPRPGLTDVMSRDASKVSALDFAEQHGLEIQDQRAVELPDDELRERAEKARQLLRGLLEIRVDRSTRRLKDQIVEAQNQLRQTKQAVEYHRARKPRGWLALFTRPCWATELEQLAGVAETSKKSLHRLELDRSIGIKNPDDVRKATRSELVRQYPREAESIQAWQDRQSLRRSTLDEGRNLNQGRTSGPSVRRKGRSA